MKQFQLAILLLFFTGLVKGQDLVRIVRWVSPVTGDFETLREDFNSDAQLRGWGYRDKLFQFLAYKTRPSAPNTTAVNRWVMPNCAASIIIAEHEIPEATLLSWGYKNKQFLFYAFRTKPATGEFMAVTRWINTIPEGNKCRDFTLTVAENELTDDQLISYGYSGKVTQFWVPRPVVFKPQSQHLADYFKVRLVNPGFERGDLSSWTQFGSGFQEKSGDIPQAVSNWGPRSMPLGGDYWKGLTPDFSWNNGRQGNWFARSSQAATGSLVSSEFVPDKKFVTFLFGGNALTPEDKDKLRVELLVLNDGTFPSSYQKRVIKERLLGDLKGNKTGLPLYTLVSTPFPQVTVEGKSYYVIEDLIVRGDIIQKPDLFVRASFNLSEIGQTNNAKAISSVRTSLIGRKLRIRVVDETTQGYVYFDDVRIGNIEAMPSVIAQSTQKPLWGFVDMHTHPMSHLGFGNKLMHGAPDIGSLIPAGTHDCVSPAFRARTVQEALGNCNATHGGWGADNSCGNYLRAGVISKAFDKHFVYNTTNHNPFDQGGNLHGDHQHNGIEANFQYWPHQTSLVHQQMWWEWLKRAHDGGLRTMVALTVNSELLATVIDGDMPYDDKGMSDVQIDEIISFVNRHSDFMAIARSASEMRQIVKLNKLAIVLGVEVDNLGNFNKPGVICNEATVKAEVQRLYSKGVRYVFPIHLVDNKFGGTAVYEDLFNLANKYATGDLFTVSTSPDPKITYRLGNGLDENGNLDLKVIIDAASNIPFPPAFNLFSCPVPTLGCWDKFKFLSSLVAPDRRYAAYVATPGGHVNSKGLTSLGGVAIREMMRLGMLIDLDHMSQRSMEMTVELAGAIDGGYPLNIGHNGIRGNGGKERAVDSLIAQQATAWGGMFGVGTADTDASKFIVGAGKVSETIGQHGLALGTDANGMERLPNVAPGVRATTFYDGFKKCKMDWGGGSREWDFTKEGAAHYGLIPDFLQDMSGRVGATRTLSRLFSGAEYFARMWERCEQQKTQVR